MAGFSGIMGPDSVDPGSVANSPFNIFGLVKLFWKLLLVLVPSLVGHAFYRDYKSRTHNISYSFPISKRDYLLGKFASSFLVVILIASMIGLGFSLGATLPGVQEEYVTEWSLTTYWIQYALFVIPNLFLISIVVAAVVLATRSVFAGFVSIIMFFILAQILLRLSGYFNSPTLSIMLDPFGELGIEWMTKDWTSEQQNVDSLPISSLLIQNRILWMAIAGLVGTFAYLSFSFSHLPLSERLRKSRKSDKNTTTLVATKLSPEKLSLDFSPAQQFRSALGIAKAHFKQIVFSKLFLGLSLLAIGFVIVLISQMNPPFGSSVIPRTWVMLSFPVFFVSLFIHLITFLYSGLLANKGRMSEMDSLVDISPFGNHVFLIGNLLAMIAIQCLLLFGVMFGCMAVQIYSGYYHLEIGLYLVSLFGIHLIGFVIWAIASFFTHSLVRNFYIGLFVLIFAFFAIPNLAEIGLDSAVYQFNADPEEHFYLNYSDMAGFGHGIKPFFAYKLYWLLFSAILFVLTLLLWSRGLSNSISERVGKIRARFSPRVMLSLAILIPSFLTFGFMLRKSELSEFGSLDKKELSRIKKENGDAYKAAYAGFVQPRVVDIKTEIDLYPSSKMLEAKGVYLLENKTSAGIDTLLIHYTGSYEKTYEISAAYDYILQDSLVNFDVLRLKKTLAPGDQLEVRFKSRAIPNTWLKKNNAIESDGAFIVSSLGLEFGYYTDTSDLLPEDSLNLGNHYRSIDADYVDLELVISTDQDQIVVASGILEKEWTDKGRNYFRYVSNEIATRDYAFCSGRYEIARDSWNDVEFEFYYHKGHDYNVESIFDGLKKTLDYHTKYFGPYQHPKIKIAEFARSQGNYVQAFAGLLTWSEISLIIDPESGADLNLPFLGAAHELAHLWWGHQVIPADVMGGKLINEGMAEFISSQVLRHSFGEEVLKNFRLRQRRDYLRNRNKNFGHERSLKYNRGLKEGHVPYQKGSLVLSTLSDYLGEQNLNSALRKFYLENKYPNAPYPTTIEFIDRIREVTPDSLAYLITDLFERVSFYKLKANTAIATKLPDGRYKMIAEFDVRKIWENEGGENEQTVNDYLMIEVRSESAKILSQLIKVNSGGNVIELIVDEIPRELVLDPYVQLIEKDRDDNNLEISLN